MTGRVKTAISIFLLLFPLFACAVGNGPLFVKEAMPADSDPCIYLYRPDSVYLQAAKWEFVIDKTRSITLANGAYARIPITPGKHEIVSGMSQRIGQRPLLISVEAAKGRSIYVKYEVQTQGSVLTALIDKPRFDNRLCEVEESQALLDLKELHLTTAAERTR
jgi:hypothetical protein